MIVFPKQILLAGLMLLASCLHAELKIFSVTERYWDQVEFKRVIEYFTGKEFSGRQIILRSNPEKRSGMYFELSFSEKLNALAKNSVIVLQMYRSGSLHPKLYEFKIPEDLHEKRDILLGVTGDDWPSRETKLIAWRMEVRTVDQKLLAQKQSFLWDHEK